MRLPWQATGCDRGSGTDFFRQKAALARLEVEEKTLSTAAARQSLRKLWLGA